MPKDKQEKMTAIETKFTQVCAMYSDAAEHHTALGVKLKEISLLFSTQPDTIELSIWIANLAEHWSENEHGALHEYIAESIKDRFFIVGKPLDDIQPCGCGKN